MPPTDEQAPSKTLSLRVPAHLEQLLKTIAARDANGVSATIRRLLAAGLRSEQQKSERRG